MTIAAAMTLAVGAAFGQAPAGGQPLAFEVASIKPSTPPDQAKVMSGQFRVGMSVDGARVDLRFMSIADLVRTAYKIKPHQLVTPDWMKGSAMSADGRWDIQATLPEGTNKDQVPEMLQALLAERFKLKVHKDSKEQPVYGLVVAKGGHKMKPAPAEAAPKEDDPKTPSNAVSVRQEGGGMVVKTGQGGAMKMTMGPNMTMHMESEKVTMEQFADMVTGFVDKPVVDMTELKGNWQIALDLTMDDLRAAAAKAGVAMPGMPPAGGGAPGAASDPGGPAIFSSIQQLGLKLEQKKAPVDIIVVDSAEKKPTEN
ncbi:MAG TPA: TIGR03435 family protein [Candidatus Acidoferrum sp.]|nr:TIGR03435 family protein [Candidatus Acidoferrum sp.]